MGSYGPAPQYIIKYIKQEKCLIQFTGFTTEGTLGARLKSAENGDIVPIGGMLCTKEQGWSTPPNFLHMQKQMK